MQFRAVGFTGENAYTILAKLNKRTKFAYMNLLLVECLERCANLNNLSFEYSIIQIEPLALFCDSSLLALNVLPRLLLGIIKIQAYNVFVAKESSVRRNVETTVPHLFKTSLKLIC